MGVRIDGRYVELTTFLSVFFILGSPNLLGPSELVQALRN
jgi:hypothetical protein